jgi:thioredoxin reductase
MRDRGRPPRISRQGRRDEATNVGGVYAAGDITRMGHTVTFACADGVMAALAIHRSLVFGG